MQLSTRPAVESAVGDLGPLYQSGRLVDVFLLGPFMIWYAWQAPQMPAWARTVLAVAGGLTMVANARNYLLVSRGAGGEEECCRLMNRMT